MTVRDSLRDGAQAVREYVKGIDRATAIRRLFAFWMAFTIVVSVVPPAVLYAGGPDLSPIKPVAANHTGVIEDFEDGDLNIEASEFDDWQKDFGGEPVGSKGNLTITTAAISGSFSGNVSVTEGDSFGANAPANQSRNDTTISWEVRIDGGTGNSDDGVFFHAYNGSSRLMAVNFEDGTHNITYLDSNLDKVDTGETYTDGTTYKVEFTDIDYSANTYDIVVDGTTVADDIGFINPGNSYDEFKVLADASSPLDTTTTVANYTIDNFDVFGAPGESAVSGTVTHASNGSAVDGAVITVNDSSASDTTDASGFYSISLGNGTHEITATKGSLSGTITVEVNGSDLTNQNITLSDETLSLDVPTQMFPNETAAYEVTLEGSGVTDNATVTPSDPTNLTVNEASNELEATSDVSFAGEITITAEYDGLTAERNVTVANLSAGNVALMQNAADMTAAIWGDVQGPDGTRPGGTQLTMRVLFVALLIGAAIATHASGFAGIGGITLIVVMGWFMGWVSDGMALVTVFTGLFIGLNLAANIDYSVRK